MDYNLSQIRMVTIYFEDGSKKWRLMPVTEIGTFILASINLHHSPGINPHNGNKASRASKITAAHFYLSGPYWWTTPDLQRNDDPKGATVFTESEMTVWSDEKGYVEWLKPLCTCDYAHAGEHATWCARAHTRLED